MGVGVGVGGVVEGPPGVSIGKFVFQKLSCVRFQPQSEGNVFVTGSWEDHKDNCIRLWTRTSGQQEPKEIQKVLHQGDVNHIKFLSCDKVCSGSSDGSVRLYHLCQGQLEQRTSWERLHRAKSGALQSCHSVTSLTPDQLCSVGEDGRLFLLSLRQDAPVRKYEEADSCSLTAATFIKQDEVFVSNMRGQLKLYDFRVASDMASAIFLSSDGEQTGVSSLCKHPSQNHIVCSGSQDGKITFWDLRQEKTPITIFKGHDQAVNEVMFHPDQPEHLFSCSENGEVWHWNGANKINFANQVNSLKLDQTCWFSNEAAKSRVETVSLLPSQAMAINSLDVEGTTLIVAGDNEAVYVLNSVIV